jgi:Domain of Unknown Function with PDB structure (DUF3857)/Transglutaminase-like superfamily
MKRALVPALLFVAANAFAWGTPDWVKAAAKMQLPSYPADTPGVVLVDETTTTVRPSGDIAIRRRWATKILSTEGRDLAYASVAFNSLVKLAGVHAWSITAKGDEWEVREREAMEIGISDSMLYADDKVKTIRIPGAEPGTVVAFEYETREPAPQALQDAWAFQRELPVRSARYTLVLPEGWSHDVRWLNSEPKTPQKLANGLTWEVSDVPAVKPEPGRPPMSAVAGRMSVNFYPPQQQGAKRSWKDFGVWYNGLVGDRRAATPELKKKVAELTAGKTSTLDKIAALARFAQKDVRYVAIEIGIGRYQPHAAGDVLGNRYGDCKDKVTVLAAMLRDIGVESHYVITTTVRGAVDRQFASMDGFNHAIIAIRLPRDVKSEKLRAVIEHPKLGRLLLFDPTSSVIPLGDLPNVEQQGHGLLVTDGGGDLIDFPLLAPETNTLQRSAKLKLDESLVLSGAVTETWSGGLAARLRGNLQAMSASERVKFIERVVASHIADFKVSGFAVENLDDVDKDLVLKYALSAPAYAKRTGGLVLVRPRVLGAKAEGVLDLKERKHGYRTEGPSFQVDEIEIAAPASLALDELPEKTAVSVPAFTYDSETTFEGGVLRYKRRMRMKEFDVPLSGLAELNRAFSAILADERSSAVFKAP